ncbi:MAG: CDP-diacylglycerol--serine O-phosphatidyltransferase [Deltaproteobacteria bacterium RIFCSPLOWO2_02_FULL_50_16]|nr:MAG: CDP-diacylglycerol--serine O-phosphatidyltransferase [Deltaproteobacteria bacterium GWA2_50_8]OGQ26230.1 MAG: CDP-diacylglycerol--serine O-phosphatidyltransferase [Deltaproteobacteria bacterium RIFCSPHIGHO2_02_FULL_50_15]OGQ58391.1 MAG: CDP-diacylglycerol--serine O-phosphatidyltransferase [Deltaproteobacteria bacterium RIFCSPLOWO2_02_FULL_50_16]OGQ67541.1 MAG: CDP-diacylglycerol--serine O-phosphatidyltransferase [Deltaproteobacteria bacterium RIFCSPLOWO2_12_FULL_50_11]
MKRIGIAKGIYILPNLFTIASLFFGFYSILKSLNGSFRAAIIFILISGLFDLLDGRIARLTKSESDFGLELDSLVDLISFGVAPAILIYRASLSYFGRFGWLAAFLFIACGALRLARYNVQVSNVEKRYFQGLPIPAAAGMVVTFVLFYRYFLGDQIVHPPISFALVVLLSLLMVSPIRYHSLKISGLKARNSFYVLVALLVVIVVIAIKPEVTMFIFGSIYVLEGILEWIFFGRKRARETQAMRTRSTLKSQKLGIIRPLEGKEQKF